MELFIEINQLSVVNQNEFYEMYGRKPFDND